MIQIVDNYYSSDLVFKSKKDEDTKPILDTTALDVGIDD
jgi:hypothetical protein